MSAILMQIVDRIRTPYNEVDVWQTGTGFDFEVAGGTHAMWRRDRILTGYVWDAITAAALLREKGPPASLLMLGLGGGTSVRQLRHFVPTMSITAVEIDPQMVALARRYMHLDELEIQIEIADGYAFAQSAGPNFDAVIDDIYLGESDGVARPAPYHRRRVRSLCSCLKPGGLLVTNVITSDGHRKMRTQARSAYSAVFGTVTSVKPWKGFNETLLGGSTAEAHTLERYLHMLTDPVDQQAWRNLGITRF